MFCLSIHCTLKDGFMSCSEAKPETCFQDFPRDHTRCAMGPGFAIGKIIEREGKIGWMDG